MDQVTCKCLIIVLVLALSVIQPTFELFIKETNNNKEERTQLEEKSYGDEETKIYQADIEARLNERDKLNPDLNPGLQPYKFKRIKKLRRKRSEDTQVQRSADKFVFPDQVPTSPTQSESLQDRLFVVPNTAGPPPCARGDTFCESVDEYPAEHVIRLLRKEPVFVRGFFQDERKHYSVVDDVQDRIDASDENPLCAAREHTVYPKMAKNIEGNWLFVINQDEYIQGVRVEKCLNDRECSFPASLPNGYRSQCKQKYIYRKLVALNGTGQGVISDSFQFPSCCSCVIKLDHGLAFNRFGGSSSGGGGALPLTLPKTTITPSPLKHKNKN